MDPSCNGNRDLDMNMGKEIHQQQQQQQQQQQLLLDRYLNMELFHPMDDPYAVHQILPPTTSDLISVGHVGIHGEPNDDGGAVGVGAGGGEGGEDDEEEERLGALKEMMYKIAAMQPVDIDPLTIKKPKRRNVRISDDPQSVAARHRREKISERIRILQRLVPGGTKMDTASMLDEAIRYVKFLKRQVHELQSWPQPTSASLIGRHSVSSTATDHWPPLIRPAGPNVASLSSIGRACSPGLGLGFSGDGSGSCKQQMHS